MVPNAADFRARLSLNDPHAVLTAIATVAAVGRENCSHLIEPVLEFISRAPHYNDVELVRSAFTFLLSLVGGSVHAVNVTNHVVRTVSRISTESSSLEVKITALRMLGTLPLPLALSELVKALPNALKSPAPAIRVRAVQCLPRLLSAFKEDGGTGPVSSTLALTLIDEINYVSFDDEPQVRVAAFSTLLECSRGGLIPPSCLPLPELLRMETPGKLQRVLDLVGTPSSTEIEKVQLLDLVGLCLQRAAGSSSSSSEVLFGVMTMALGFVSHAAPSVVFAAIRVLMGIVVLLSNAPSRSYVEEEMLMTILTRIGAPLKALVANGASGSQAVQMLACQAIRVVASWHFGVALGLRDVPPLLPKHDDPPALVVEKLLAAAHVGALSAGLSGAQTGEGDDGREAMALMECLLTAMGHPDPSIAHTGAHLMGSVGFDLGFVLLRMEEATRQALGPGQTRDKFVIPDSEGGMRSRTASIAVSPDSILLCLRELYLRNPQSSLAPPRILHVARALSASPEFFLGPHGRAAAAFLASFGVRTSPDSAGAIISSLVEFTLQQETTTDVELLELLGATARLCVANSGSAADRGYFDSIFQLCTEPDRIEDPLVRGRAFELSRLLGYHPGSGSVDPLASEVWFQLPQVGPGVVDPALGTLDRRELGQLLCSIGRASCVRQCSLESAMVSPRELKTGNISTPVKPSGSRRRIESSIADKGADDSGSPALEFGGMLDLTPGTDSSTPRSSAGPSRSTSFLKRLASSRSLGGAGGGADRSNSGRGKAQMSTSSGSVPATELLPTASLSFDRL